MSSVLPILLHLASTAAADSSLRFAHSYGSHMVLQQAPLKSFVWGYASSTTDNVTVTLTSKSGHASSYPAKQTGNVWSVTLDATEGGSDPYTLTAKEGSNSATVITDVLFGDVWVCR